MIPEADAITADWLTSALKNAGHDRAQVESFTATTIGTGQIGKCVRFDLELADGAGAAPRTLVGKFPSDDPQSRQTGVDLQNYLKEVRFYQELASRLQVRVPKCYFAEIDGVGPSFALLLEDMAPAEQGDQIEGCSIDVARAGLRELVGLHAPSWGDTSLRDREWLGTRSPESVAIVRGMYGHFVGGFIDRFGPNLEPDEIDIIRKVADSKGPPYEYPDEPFSLVHIDFRLDNLLIDETQSPPTIAVVDWQSITLGQPLADVAYFLGASLLPETRRKHEQTLVREYHDQLLEAGIQNYDFDTCYTDYRRGAFAGFAVTVVASMLVGATERGDRMFTAMAKRHARHALDLGSEEFLG